VSNISYDSKKFSSSIDYFTLAPLFALILPLSDDISLRDFSFPPLLLPSSLLFLHLALDVADATSCERSVCWIESIMLSIEEVIILASFDL
jgi:hypothetical protein